MMNKRANPDVSIGLPVYNSGPHLREALTSLISQTFKNFEIIISDNCSTDDTQAICEEFQKCDPRVRYVRQESNIGVVANFRFVLNYASSECFMWAAGDDVWDANWLEVVVPLVSHSPPVAGFGELNVIDESSAKLCHGAAGAKLQFSGMKIFRKLRFFLAPESRGKSNLFYAIYPRVVLEKLLDWEKFLQDYLVLYVLLDQLCFHQAKGAVFHKRSHRGAVSATPRTRGTSSSISLMFREFRLHLTTSCEYLSLGNWGTRIAIMVLIPLKVIRSLGARK